QAHDAPASDQDFADEATHAIELTQFAREERPDKGQNRSADPDAVQPGAGRAARRFTTVPVTPDAAPETPSNPRTGPPPEPARSESDPPPSEQNLEEAGFRLDALKRRLSSPKIFI